MNPDAPLPSLLSRPLRGRLLLLRLVFHPAHALQLLRDFAITFGGGPRGRQETHQTVPGSLYFTNEAVSATSQAYSASARIATRLFSNSETSSPSMVTVAWVETS